MLETLLTELSQHYSLTELDPGEFARVKASGMTFSIRAFCAEGLGHVSLMSATGFFGLIKMDTLIINPIAVDLPLYSYDRIHAMGNDTLIVELYNTLVNTPGSSDDVSHAVAPDTSVGSDTFSPALLQAVKARFADLPVHLLGEHWYDTIKLPESLSHKGKKAQTARFDELTLAHFKAYLEAAPKNEADAALIKASPEAAAKLQKAAYYVDGLLQNGGPSTDVFKKALGVEKTAELFRKVLFETEKQNVYNT